MAISKVQAPGKTSGLISLADSLNTNYFQYGSGGYARYGHMVFVNLRVNVVNTIPDGGGVNTLGILNAGGLPAPIQDGNSVVTPVILSAYEQGSGSALNPYVLASGGLVFGRDFPGMSTNKAIWISGVYLTDN